MKRQLLIDSNIINYAAKGESLKDKPKKLAFASFLKEVSKEYEPAISAITRYELFEGSTSKTAKRVKSLTDNLRTYEVSKDVLNLAAILSTCYKTHDATKGHCSAISIADKVIAATCLLTKDSHVLTSDFNDFPRPFFTEVKRLDISYIKDDTRKVQIELYVLRPDIIAYSNCFKLCYP